MARIAFILLCHKNPEQIIKQVRDLTVAGDYVAIHFDANSPKSDYAAIRAAFEVDPAVTFARRRVKCGWGEWSLVQATLSALEAAYHAFPKATHFYMISGDCMAIKSAVYAHDFLDRHDADFIESFDFHSSGWIKTGLREERLIYWHFLNERKRKAWFYGVMRLQRALGLRRHVPADLDVMIGSQWWCLRRKTIGEIFDFLKHRPDVTRFFRYTWIPDETFFQTLVRHLVSDREIECRTLTFLVFSDYGMPAVFYSDHYDLLVAQNYLFARKISPEATILSERLGALWSSGQANFSVSDGGRQMYHFLRGRGRVGQRFARRFWERDGTIGQGRELLMIVCKKWHVAKRMMHAAARELNLAGVEYLFDELDCGIPHLGGIERTMEKRNRHRRALVHMLFDYYQTDRLMICLDPNNINLIHDFMSDQAHTKILEIQCLYDDAYLRGHAIRVNLASRDTPPEVIDRMMPSLRYEFTNQSAQMQEARFDRHFRLRQDHATEANAEVLAGFFSISPQRALTLAQSQALFDD